MATENEDGGQEENLDLPEVKEGEEDTTDYKAEALKLRDKAIAQRERTKSIKKERDDVKKALEAITNVKRDEPKPKSTGELDETQLDYLDLKGISDQDEIDVIEKVMARTGQTVRQALKDDYVISKLEGLRKDKAVKDATPSGSKRGGNQTGDIASAIAQFEKTGDLPSDFALASAVTNALVERSNTNKPSWK